MHKYARILSAIITAVLLLAVTAASARQYANAYRLTEGDPIWAGIAAGIVVGTILLSFLNPSHYASRVGFWVLVGSAFAAALVNAAIPLGIVEYAPLLWNIVVFLMVAIPTPVALWVIKSVVVEAEPEPIPKALPKPKPERNSPGFGVMVRVSKPKPKPKPATETPFGAATETDTDTLYETLGLLRQVGKVAKVAASLGISPAAVNKRLRKLYDMDRAAVERDAPEWVERNIGSKVE
jgi:hypothetical protein